MLKKIENILVGILMFLPFIGNAQIYLSSNFNNTSLTGWTQVPSIWTANNSDLRTTDVNAAAQPYIYQPLSGLNINAENISWEFTITDLVAPTTGNNWGVWLFANETNLVAKNGSSPSLTIQGYFFGVDIAATGGADYHKYILYKVNGNTYTPVVSTGVSDVTATSTTNNWKITRSISGNWEVFLNAASTGTGTDATYTTSTYFGAYQEYSSSNYGKVRFDDILIKNKNHVQLIEKTITGSAFTCLGNNLTLTIQNVQDSVDYYFKDNFGTNIYGPVSSFEGGNISYTFQPTVSETYKVLAVSQFGSNSLLFSNTLSNQIINLNTNYTLSNNLCSPASFSISQSGSELGVSYTLKKISNNTIASGPINGTGNALIYSLTNILLAEQYYVEATKSGCTSLINDTSNFQPANFTQNIKLSNPSICSGSRANIFMTKSTIGNTYELYNVTTNLLDTAIVGTGDTIKFKTKSLFSSTNFVVKELSGNCSAYLTDTSKVYVSSGNEQPTIVINEVSQGDGGSREYVEFLVVGSPCCSNQTLDLRGYYIDDNNGSFNPPTTNGVADGSVRFKKVDFWKSIKVGTLITIYNGADKNAKISSSYPNVSPYVINPYSIIIAVDDGAYFTKHTSLPSSINPNYPSTGYVSTSINWTPLSMANTDDSFQIRDSSANLLSAISWGDNVDLLDPRNVDLPQNVSGTLSRVAFSNNLTSYYNNKNSNWSQSPVANETPGKSNNNLNADWINTLINGGAGNLQTNLQVSDATVCLGSTANVVVSNTQSGFTYNLHNSSGTIVATQVSGGGNLILVTPANNNQFNSYKVSVSSGVTCQSLLTDTSLVTTVFPNNSLTVNTPIINSGQVATLSIFNTEPTVRYTISSLTGDSLLPSVNGNGGTVSFYVTPSTSINYLVKASSLIVPGCETFLLDTINVTVKSNLKLVINEVTQGDGGNKEYVELVVTGPISCNGNPTLDLRNWYLDDNNGDFGTNGVMPGAIKFSNNPFWSALKRGTIIVIYNSGEIGADISALIPFVNPITYQLNNDPYKLIVPINATGLFESCTSIGIGCSAGPTTWNPLSMANDYDSFQVFNDSEKRVSSVSWGDNADENTPGHIVNFDTNFPGYQVALGTDMNTNRTAFFVNTNNNDPHASYNWTQTNNISPSPGYGNNTENTNWIGSLIDPTINNTLAVTDPTICLGATAIIEVINPERDVLYTLYENGYNLGLTVNGNNANVSFSVSPTVNVLYQVKAKRADGSCNTTLIDNSLVTISQPNFILSPNESICLGDTADLAAAGLIHFEWQNLCSGCSSVLVSPSNTTTYTVTGVNDLGCQKTKSVKVTVIKPIDVSIIGNTFMCANQPIYLEAFVTGPGANNLSYTWEPLSSILPCNGCDSDIVLISPIVTTDYSVKASNGVCTATDTISVIVANPLSINFTDTSFNNTLYLDATGTDTNTGTFEWEIYNIDRSYYQTYTGPFPQLPIPSANYGNAFKICLKVTNSCGVSEVCKTFYLDTQSCVSN